MLNNWDFGDPGVGSSGQDFLPNGGWEGDPGVAPITDPAISAGGTRLILTNIGYETVAAPAQDIVAAVSDDGGQSFHSANYVNVLGLHNGGCDGNAKHCVTGVDGPFIASDPNPPFSTYVAWTAEGAGYLNWIRYDLPSGGGDPFTKGSVVIPIADSASTGTVHPTFAFGSVTPCGGTQPDEFIFVAWPDTEPANARCGGTQQLENMRWHWAAYDTATGNWYPSKNSDWLIDQDTAWPDCIGNPINVAGPGGEVGWNSTNEPFVSVAALNNQVLFAYDRSGANGLGTRIQLKGFTLQCKAGKLIPLAGPSVQSPDPCYHVGYGCNTGDGGPGGGNGPDGGNVIVDEWGPVVSFLPNPPSSPPLVVTWNTTRDDLTYNNQYATIYGGRAFGFFSNPFLDIFRVANQVQPGDMVPWDHNAAPWWDYQALGNDPSSGSFLAAWGGDARLGGPSGIWTAQIFP